jgi:hypothetical protein
MIKQFIVKAAVKAANFTEISAFMLASKDKWVAVQVSLDHSRRTAPFLARSCALE